MKDILNKRGESPSNEPSKTPNTKNFLLVTALIFILIVGGIFLWGYYSSTAGQRTIASAVASIKDLTITPISNFFAGVFSTGAGDYFDYSTNSSSKKMGIDLKDFRMVAGESMPAGYPMDFLYDIEYTNVPRDSTYDAEFTCYFNVTKRNDQTLNPPEKKEGTIIPSSEMTIHRDTQAICRFTGDETADLSGPYVVYGSFAFDYATKDVTIPVYFISGELSDSLGDQDFFSAYGLDVSSSDLKTTYNGEPLSIGISAVGESGKQPVIVRSGDVISYNTLGIMLKNEWNGDLLELQDFTLSLPSGIELDDQLNGDPSPSCPFVYTGEENRYNTYKLDDSMVDMFKPYFASNSFFGTKDYHSFQCWLKIDPEMLSNAPYIIKQYKAEASYRYQVDEKSDPISIIGQGESLIVGAKGAAQ